MLVEAINRAWGRGTLDHALQVGKLVLEAFYGGDVERFRRHGRKAASLRSLCREPGLRMSRASLWRAVAVFAEWERLPEALALRLSLAQHEALFGIAPEARIEIATLAHSAGWSARRIRAEIPGRPPSASPRRHESEAVRAARRVLRRVQAMRSASAEDGSELRSLAEQVAAAVDAWRCRLA